MTEGRACRLPAPDKDEKPRTAPGGVPAPGLQKASGLPTVFAGLVGFFCGVLLVAAPVAAQTAGQAALERARVYQQNGQTAELRAAAAEALRANPADAASRLAAAQLLDLAASPDRVAAYQQVIESAGSAPEAQLARRRLVLLHLTQRKQEEAHKTLEAYQAAGGNDLEWPRGHPSLSAGSNAAPGSAVCSASAAQNCPTVEIPGPLLAFERMAAIRPGTGLEEVLSALMRNVSNTGYWYSTGKNTVAPTEYLKLIKAYLQQARELQALAAPAGVLRVSNCAQAAPLLKVLGYRARGGLCAGPDTRIEVETPARAFLTNDSGFPVMLLENALRGGAPFQYSVAPVRLPVLFGAEAWGQPGAAWLDSFLDDFRAVRLYAALFEIDTRTAELLRESPGLQKLKPVASTLDFYGRMLRVVDGRVDVPGGPAAAGTWKQITGAEPGRPGEFIPALLMKDSGWAAAWFDALWYASPGQLQYLTDPQRLVRFYAALRGSNTRPGPAWSIFRGNAQMLLLITRLRIAPNGKPLLPGGPDFRKLVSGVRASPQGPEDDILEALFAQTRDPDENSQLRVFLALNEIDRPRTDPLRYETAARLAAAYPRLGQHYSLFSSWPQLSDATIVKLLDALESLGGIGDELLRADALGSFQAVVAAWDIAAHQGGVPEPDIDPSLGRLLQAFAKVRNPADLVDAARQGVAVLLGAPSPTPDDRLLALLTGPPAEGYAGMVRDEFAARIRSGIGSQKLVPLGTLFALADQLQNGKLETDSARLVSALKETNPLDASYASSQNLAVTFRTHASAAHLWAERDTDLARAIQTCADRPPCRPPLRGLLSPFLRDTLVGFIYAYYAPPGSRLLHNNPLLVRSHDFLGKSGHGTGNTALGPERISALEWPWVGAARLVGPLSGLAYALADAEKNFLVPRYTQALIGSDLAPQLLLSGTQSQWWRVPLRTQHWAALHLRLGRDLLAEACLSADARRLVMGSLPFLEARRRKAIEDAFLDARPDQANRLLTPAELYGLSRAVLSGQAVANLSSPSAAAESADHAGAEFVPAGAETIAVARRASPAAGAIERMAAQFPVEASAAAVGAAFGVPHPLLRRSYWPELLDLPVFPPLIGYSGRLLAESWESGNLYWAEMADELALPPAELNRLIPAATCETIQQMYANDFEDWPELLDSMRVAGEAMRAKIANAGLPAPVPPAAAGVPAAARPPGAAPKMPPREPR